MDEDIRRYIGEEPLGCCFEDIAGRTFWKKILGSYWHEETADESLEMDPVQCFLLYGPFGSGKNTLLQALAGEMVQAGYRYLEVDMQEIPAGDIVPVFDILAEEYLQKGPCFLLLGHIESLLNATALWEMVGRAESAGYPLLLTAAVEDVTSIIPDIRRLFQAYYVGLPDRADRKAYFERNIDSLFEKSSIQGMKALLDGTEGFNYMQLESLDRQIRLRVKYQIINHEKTADLAMSWLQAELVEEVLSMGQPPKSDDQEFHSSELTAVLQALAAAQPVQTAPKPQTVQKEISPLEDLQARLSPKKVFDQGVTMTKK